MCGVIGYWPVDPAPEVSARFALLFEESAARGTHAYGIATLDATTKSFDLEDIIKKFVPRHVTIGHTRYCQSGDWRVLDNNQPIVTEEGILSFNGVIHMGTKAEFEAAFNVQCRTDNDGEVFLQKLKEQSAEVFLEELQGSFAGVWLRNGRLYAGRNERRPLWRTKQFGAHWYASTRDIFVRAGFDPDTLELLPVGVTRHE